MVQPNLLRAWFVMSTFIITGSGTLRVLNVSNNGISDDGMGVISETLQYSKSLTRLELADSGLSVKGTVMCVFIMSVLMIGVEICPDITLSTKNTPTFPLIMYSKCVRSNLF